MTAIEKVIDEALESRHGLGCFRIAIQSKFKDENSERRAKLRIKMNPKARENAKNLCSFCKRNVLEVNGKNTIHHILPERFSGNYSQKNLLVVCRDCHVLLENCINIVERAVIVHTLNYLKNVATKKERKDG